MRAARRISAILLGTVLFTAGLFKLMDPLGASLVVESYLKFFHLLFLRPASVYLGEALALSEALTGAAIITGVWKKVVAFFSLALLSVFTVITLILFIANPDMECGCFGEVIHLTHLQSLIKNFLLLGLWSLCFAKPPYDEPRKSKYVSFGIAAVSVVLYMIFFCFNLPANDYTSMKPGTELMGEDNEGVILSFSNENGEYADSLALDGQVMIFSLYDPDRLTQSQSDCVEECYNQCTAAGIRPLALFASTPEDHPFYYYADRQMLMTLNRANAGATLICDGQIVAKWRPGQFPSGEELKKYSQMDATEIIIAENTSTKIKNQAFLLYVFAVMLLL